MTPLNADDARNLMIVFLVGGCLIAVKLYVDHRDANSTGADWSSVDRASEPPPRLRVQSPALLERALKAIGVRDPNWNSAQFLERAKKGFSQVQAAWSKQDLAGAQGFLSDAVYERFSLQIGEQKSEGVRDHMEQLRIINARIVQAETGSRFDTLHVAIRASAINYRVSLHDNRRIDGSTQPEEFEEIWSFLRRPGSRTLEKPGLIEGNCPSCGAPLEIVRAAKCTYCQAFLRSGEHDWVLAEITQACEWAPVESKTRPGIAQLSKADPGFSVQQIEDVASVVFWRLYTAFRLGKIDPMLKHAHPDFIGQLKSELAPKPDGSRKLYQTAAVGSVTVLGAAPANPPESAEAFDRIPVEVRWSWVPIEKNPQGKLTYNAIYPKNCVQAFILVRRSGVKTNIGLALSSTCCKSCGAPQTDSAGTTCDYCQTPLNEGSQDWVLERIADTNDRDVVALLKSADTPTFGVSTSSAQPATSKDSGPGFTPAPKGRATIGPDLGRDEVLHGSADALRWMAHVIFADRKVESAEIEMLKQYARTCGVSQAVFNGIVQAAQAGEALPRPPESPQETAAVYRELVRFALADGTLSDLEAKLLNEFCRRGNIPADEAARILDAEKSARAC